MEDNKKILSRVAGLEEKIRLTDQKYRAMKAKKTDREKSTPLL